LVVEALTAFGERATAFVGLFFLSGALLPVVRQKLGLEVDSVAGDPLLRYCLVPVYAVAMLVMLANLRTFGRVAVRSKISLVLVGLTIVSALWSTAPELTLRRSLALAVTTGYGLYLAMRYDTRELVELLAWALGLAVILSFVVALGAPQLGVHAHEFRGAWRGIFAHKNALGRAMTLGAVVFVLLARSTRRGQWVLWLGASACVCLVVLSRSASSIVVLATAAALWPLYASFRWRPFLRWPALIGYSVVYGTVCAGVVWFPDPIFRLLGKSTSLTGRSELWTTLVDAIQRRLWLGYGYSGFWLGWSGSSGEIWNFLGWDVKQAHNGLLDVMLQLGVLGLLLLSVALMLTFRRAAAAATEARMPVERWPILFVSLLLLQNLTESALLQQNTLEWVLYIATAASSLLAAQARPWFLAPPLLRSGRQWRARLRTRASPGIRLRAPPRLAERVDAQASSQPTGGVPDG
jgi:exopolysaccharide production protein ExoQ